MNDIWLSELLCQNHRNVTAAAGGGDAPTPDLWAKVAQFQATVRRAGCQDRVRYSTLLAQRWYSNCMLPIRTTCATLH